jgi:hypothetical protein
MMGWETDAPALRFIIGDETSPSWPRRPIPFRNVRDFGDGRLDRTIGGPLSSRRQVISCHGQRVAGWNTSKLQYANVLFNSHKPSDLGCKKCK